MAAPGTEFRILGPLEVRIGGSLAAIGGPRQRALLAMLLLNANRVVPQDRLISELLPEPTPRATARALRVQVSRLRKVLGEDASGTRLVARPPGYLLRVDAGELDLTRFEEAISAARLARPDDPVRAAELLRSADALWRGRPLADLEFEPFARIEVERLVQLRETVVEERIEIELGLGRHAELLPELEALVAEHPLREQLRGALMVALYRCGRQAAALEVYRAGRALLNDELAIEPSPQLRRLEGSILRQEPELDLTPSHRSVAVAAPSPPSVPHIPPPRVPGPEQVSIPDRRRPRTRVIALVAAGATILAVGLAQLGHAARLTANADTVAAVDAKTGSLAAVVDTGASAGGLSAGAGSIWETDTAADQLLQIDPVHGTVERIPVGGGPVGVAVGGGGVWVVDQIDRTVVEINPQALRQVAAYSVGNGASPVAVGDGAVWVGNVLDDTISRIALGTGQVTTIPLVGAPAGIAVDRTGVWVTVQSIGQLLLLDPVTGQVAQAVEIGAGPSGVAVADGDVWVADTPEGTLARFDPATGQVRTVAVGLGPVGVTSSRGSIWVADGMDGTLDRVDPNSGSVRRLTLGNQPVAVAATGSRVWVAVAAGPASHRGGTLSVVEGPPYISLGYSLDPANFAGLSQGQMLSMTNDGLVTYQRAGSLAGATLVPDLATTLPQPTQNGLTYTFVVRRGIHYSNGTLVRPEDFRRALERVFVLGNGYVESQFAGIVGAQHCMTSPRTCSLGITTNDADHTVSYHLIAPDPEFLYKLSFAAADAVPAGTPNRDLGSRPVSATGPYMTESISPASPSETYEGYPMAFRTWVLVRNPYFHEWSAAAQPAGFPDRILLTQTTATTADVAPVDSGRLDVLLPAPPGQLQQLAVQHTGQLHSEPTGAVYTFVLNTRVPPFNNPVVRQAVNLALDRSRAVAIAGGPLAAQPTCQVLPPVFQGYQPYCPYTQQPGPSGAWTAPNLAAAQRLVARSGTRGMKVSVLVQTANQAKPAPPLGAYLVSVLDRLGYRASLHVVLNPFALFEDSRQHGQVVWFTWFEDYPAPSDFIQLLLSCQAFIPGSQQNLNGAEFCRAAIDRQAQQAATDQAVDPGMANEEWARVDHEITDQAPWLPLYNPRVAIYLGTRVGNYQYHPFFLLLFDQLWVR